MNLILACLWLVLAGLFFLSPYLDLDKRLFNLGSNSILVGFLALMMCLYNVARWWSVRSSSAHQQAIREAMARQRHPDEDRPRPESPPDPNFDFREGPPR
jgi:hypothetical protein